MLAHSWTYQALVHDVLNMKLNRITVETVEDTGATSKKAYDLTSNDFFWAKNAGVPFPQVAEDIDGELTRYKEDAADITKKTGASSLDDISAYDYHLLQKLDYRLVTDLLLLFSGEIEMWDRARSI